MLTLFILGLATVLQIQSGGAANAGKRVALIIGNATYQHAGKLVTPPNDMREVAKRLKSAGFLVYEGLDLDKKKMVTLIRRFLQELDKNAVSLFYYSGHAVQVGGDNYLVPVDARLSSAYDLEQETFKLNSLLKYMENLSSAQFIFLDACRNNPFEGRNFITGALTRGGGVAGLASMKAGVGTLISYSTAPGKVAFDGTSKLSPFTGAFTKNVLMPATEIRQLLSRVRREVITSTGGRQVPWENSSLLDDFFFIPPKAAPIVKAVHEIEVGVGVKKATLGVPVPYQSNGGAVRVSFDKLPQNGQLVLNDKVIGINDIIQASDLGLIRYAGRKAEGESVEVAGYKVKDDWGNEKNGLIIIKVKQGKNNTLVRPRTKRHGRVKLAAMRKGLTSRLAKISRPPIGVGSVALNLQLKSSFGKADRGRVEVVQAPAQGQLQLAGRTLGVGASFDLSKLSSLSYRPVVGTQDKSIEAKFVIATQAGRSKILPVKFVPKIHECDRLAGQPFDLQGVAPGVYADKIKGDKAKKACLEALAEYPKTARFLFQLGRAELALGRSKNATQLVEMAAKKGHIRADHTLGKLLSHGGSGRVNNKLANAHFQVAALKGDVYGMYSLGKNLFYGLGAKADHERGLTLMLQASEMGHTFAMNELSRIFRNGLGVKKDPGRAVRFSMASALRNDIYGYNNLAIHFLNGVGVKQDRAKAFAWFLKAHKGGHPEASNNIGRMYQNGWGVPQNADIAAGWYEKSAIRGSAWAANNRAWLALNGPRQVKSGVMAAKYYALSVALERHKASVLAKKSLTKLDKANKRRATQIILNELGYRTKRKDGQFGTATHKAIKAFGRQHSEAQIDDPDKLLVSLAKAWWIKNKPRFDLF